MSIAEAAERGDVAHPRGRPVAEVRLVLSVGTDHHPFDRLVDWTDRWIATAGVAVSGLAQVGASRPSAQLRSAPIVDRSELAEAMASAHAVVCHAGPGTISDARQAGVEPIVVPRSGLHHEHVDGHQQRFASWLQTTVGLLVAREPVALSELLGRLLVDPDAYRCPARTRDVDIVATRFGELVDELLG